MPQVIMASSATSIVAPIPQAALNGPRMILKRPTKPSSTTSPSNSNPTNTKAYGDREASYQAARERIFGTPSPAASSGTSTPTNLEGLPESSSSNPTSPPASSRPDPSNPIPPPQSVIRHPRGPPSAATLSDQPGFIGRKPGAIAKGHRRMANDLDVFIP